jgi:hypothetical protein
MANLRLKPNKKMMETRAKMMETRANLIECGSKKALKELML